MNEELKLIKKYYGEKFMQLCRALFPTILDEEGLLIDILLKTFEPNHFLYDDLLKYKLIDSFNKYIIFLSKPKNKEIQTSIPLSPKKLMSEAGYNLYECHTEEDIQSFKKYYQDDEALCTFNGGRLDRCYVFFAVKDNASELKRKNFKKPDRQDEYGTSVISIQFSKGSINTLSIKNRYNHTVINPDATFSNNLDNIIEGLNESFRYYYKLRFECNNLDFGIPNYVRASDGRYYKYNYEKNNVYYCIDNIIIDNFKVNRNYTEKERYVLFDYFILDLKEKNIKFYDGEIHDSFIDSINSIEKIYIKKDNNGNKDIVIIMPNKEEVIIKINKYNQMINYKNNNIKEIGSYFLYNICYLENIELNNVEKIGDNFLKCANRICKICLPNVEEIGDYFLEQGNLISEVYLPNVKYIGDYFINTSLPLMEIKLPNVIKIGDNCLGMCFNLREASFPKLEQIGGYFQAYSHQLEKINLPKVKNIGRCFCLCNNSLTSLSLPDVLEIKELFLAENTKLRNLKMDNIREIDANFLPKNKHIKKNKYILLTKINNDQELYNKEISNINSTNNKLLKYIRLKLLRSRLIREYKKEKSLKG